MFQLLFTESPFTESKLPYTKDKFDINDEKAKSNIEINSLSFNSLIKIEKENRKYLRNLEEKMDVQDYTESRA